MQLFKGLRKTFEMRKIQNQQIRALRKIVLALKMENSASLLKGTLSYIFQLEHSRPTRFSKEELSKVTDVREVIPDLYLTVTYLTVTF